MVAEKCLDCHRPLRQRIAAGEGLHARPDHRRCESCHIEHHGREFDLIFWGEAGRDAFDHRLAGWPLQGAHARAACRDCHRPEHVADPGLRAAGVDLSRTFLGLSTACTSCHEDEHRGQFADRSCTDCHGIESWRPAPGFDHAETAFPLAGEHAGVACAGCHREARDPASGETFRRFAGLEFGACSDCHADPHRGQFAGRACSSCHSVEGWDLVRGFDHDRTRFPLTGRHRQTACGECHPRRRDPETGRTSRRFRGLEFGACSDCHADPHRGRLGDVCSSCHTTAGWGSVDRAAFDHDRTRFPLRGDHARLECGACHGGSPSGDVAVTIAGRRLSGLTEAALDRCATCHADPHAGQLGAHPGGCAECHTVEGFLPATFGIDEHQATGFPLEGAHLAVPCDACHPKVPRSELSAPDSPVEPIAAHRRRPTRGGAEPTTRFRFASPRCAACHADPHGGEVDRWIAAGGCESCHAVERWSDVTFDHSVTGFALGGAHAEASCRSCHGAGAAGESEGRGADRLRFPGLPTTCAGCHGDPHLGQLTETRPASLAALPSSACTRCHGSTESWAADLAFDHRRDAAFVLDGAHGRLACAACHRRETANGVTFVRYKPLPTACEGCHAGSVSAAGSSRDLE